LESSQDKILYLYVSLDLYVLLLEFHHEPHFSLPSFLKRNAVCPFQLFNQLTAFHEIWYEHAIGNHPNLIVFNFLQSVITRWMHKPVRWEQHSVCDNRCSKSKFFYKL